jgi:hypothetical protein
MSVSPVIMIVVIPIMIGMPAVLVLIPPSMVDVPAVLTRFMQLVSPVLGLLTPVAVMLDSFV